MVSRLVRGWFSNAPCEERRGGDSFLIKVVGMRLRTKLNRYPCCSVHLCCNTSILTECSNELRCTYLAGTLLMLAGEPSCCHHSWIWQVPGTQKLFLTWWETYFCLSTGNASFPMWGVIVLLHPQLFLSQLPWLIVPYGTYHHIACYILVNFLPLPTSM